MSKELGEFYLAYLAWLVAGAPHNKVFDRRTGLCSAIDFLDNHTLNLGAELTQQFIAAGLDTVYPFNTDGKGDHYSEETKTKTAHLNPKRIAWVEHQAALYRLQIL